MKKFILVLLAIILSSQTVFSMQIDTAGWIDNSDIADIYAFELDLKSDLKNDFRFYQATLLNKTNNTIDITIETNKNSKESVINIIHHNLSIKELMQVPKEIALESYKEDVGSGKIAKAHKGLIYLSSTAGAVAAGAGFLGVYPQQKFEEYVSHKKIKKEYKKITNKLIDQYTLAPFEQIDFLMLVPLNEQGPYLKTNSRLDENDIYSEYHQL